MDFELMNARFGGAHRKGVRRLSLAGGRLTGLRKDEGGAASVEIAASFMMLITLVLAVIEVSMMIYTYGVMAEAARHGVRYATVHGADSATCSGPTSGCTDQTGTNVVSDVTTFAGSFVKTMSGATVQVSYPDSAATPSSRVTVTITYTYQPLFNFPGFSRTFHPTAQGRILY